MHQSQSAITPTMARTPRTSRTTTGQVLHPHSGHFGVLRCSAGEGSEAHRDVASTWSRSMPVGQPKNGHEQDERTAATQDDQHGV
jgi:hypothetical protein